MNVGSSLLDVTANWQSWILSIPSIASKGWLDDLKHANAMAGAPPGWQAPCFKPKEVLKESDRSTSQAATSATRFDVPPVPTVSSEAPSKTLEALDAAWSEEIPERWFIEMEMAAKVLCKVLIFLELFGLCQASCVR